MWDEARKAISESSEESSVYIGCDSLISTRRRKNGKTEVVADYSTVIVLHKDSRHGCKIFHSYRSIPDHGQLEPRLYTEVQHSLEAYEAIKDVLGNRHLEVHLDVNPDPRFASSRVSAQALGWVRGLGLDVKIKPDGFAATHAADHCVRRKSAFKNF